MLQQLASPQLPSSRSLPFNPGFSCNDVQADITLIAADNVPFYAHRCVLQYASKNAFGGFLTCHDESIKIPEVSAVLSLVLHIVYGLSCLQLTPTLDTIETAANVLIKYGVPLRNVTAPNSPLYQLILSHAPHRPIDAYAFAAYYNLEALAVAVSSHLLAYNTSNLTDEISTKMGPVYLKRLFDLHETRRSALKAIVMKPPRMHRPNLACGTGEQRQLTQAWAFAAAEMAWDVQPGESELLRLDIPNGS